jgi:FkbM family methyltransferase
MQTLVTLARSVRHAPLLERMDFLWNAVRKPYRRALEIWGAPFVLGGRHSIRLPAWLADQDWNSYEVESARVFGDWIKAHPAGVVLDVGAGWGIYTALALNCSQRSRVIAFDADLASLRATRAAAARLHPEGRLDLVYGLVSDTNNRSESFAEVVRDTEQRILAIGQGARPAFVCIGDEGTSDVPVRKLDDLIAGFDASTPTLLKIDIEGAELLALRGARQWLERQNTAVLLSLHPQYLTPRYGHTPEQVLDLLKAFGYSTRMIATDHEQHWWCTK